MIVDREIRKQLDALVGERFEPPRPMRARLLKWIAGAILGVGAAAVVMAILHIHLTQAQTAPAPKKPVPVRIVPVQ